MSDDRSQPPAIRCTVAIPVYNRETLVRRALDSALAQSVEGLEIVVVDNCSTDATWETLQAYVGDGRVRLVRNERNLGLFGNFNRCLSLARGEYVRFLCSDDRLAPDCLEAEIAVMRRHPDTAMLTTRARHVDEHGRLLRLFGSELPPAIYDGRQAIHTALWLLTGYGKNPMNCPSGVLIRRAAARQAGEFDTGVTMVGDLQYYFRLLRHGNLAVTDSVGCEMLIHSEQVSSHHGHTGATVAEFHRLIEENADVLASFQPVREIYRQTVAWLYWGQLRAWSIGVWPGRDFRRERRNLPGYGPVRAWFDLARIAVRRAGTRAGRPYSLPFAPLRSLDDAPTGQAATA